ncbi:MAG: aldo/keto reductase [Clostridiales bacterium GWF2_38_85]|nr:MAG: aldo/keto reductase [Clostridiales bacterium GWF2_38_85]HBL85056.1 aldo/keto reductase [Clostridiales bacterium]
MDYKVMENIGIKTSLLGFGCMRFPLLDDGKINEPEAQRLLDTAIEAGVNYIDTAYFYLNGQSEPFVGKALKKHDRSKLNIATKLPVWNVNSVDDAKRIFQEQCDKLQTDYIDFYLIHALNKHYWDKMKECGAVDYCVELKKQGKIKNLGFSFHDEYPIFEEILTYRKWDFCQIQFNYMDTDYQAGEKGYKLAESLGIPLVIMEPVKGGALANLPDDITKIFKAINPLVSTASWSFRWLASHPNVKVILSGMTAIDQVEDNIKTFSPFVPLSRKECTAVDAVANALRSRVRNDCTGCEYCMPCPSGVNIPHNFSIWNQHSIYGNDADAKWAYFNDLNESARADKCVECSQCEAVCPQKLHIIENLKSVVKDMESLNKKS